MSHFCVYVMHDAITSVEHLLEKFDENLHVEPYIEFTKEQAIERFRKDQENYKNTVYAKFINDPEAYKLEHKSSPEHIKYLEEDFPKELEWTDEECYKQFAKDYEYDFRIDEDGNLMSTYNPNSKWDWWVVGGRWHDIIPNNEIHASDFTDDTEIPFAFVTPEGEWIERGSMGWFGMASHEIEKDEWAKKVREYVKSLPPTTIITAVDCHI